MEKEKLEHADEAEDKLLDERLAAQHKMMDGDGPKPTLVDRTDRASWPEIHELE